MSSLTQYQVVRVVKLERDPDAYATWDIGKRAPQIGDVGTIIEIAQDGDEVYYLVESVADDGTTTWMADLLERELEPQP